ncbi:aminotransferase class I/II-fold pyridoxal phosphate-dependent enzyme [Streptomyces sp. NPDC046985]|uniref:pyridoxal phosphate-dependent aminotransferase n=1 Tax=Streptomyces sp. NPDC046985 TaxID=3155377 RepID=UPI00340FD10B
MAGNVTSLFRGASAHGASPEGPEGGHGEVAPVEGADGGDFSVSCNPYFPTPAMFQEMAGRLREIVTSCPSGAETVASELCELLGLPPQCVALGNGAGELVTWIDHLLVRDSLAVPVPAFGRWTEQPARTGKRVDMFPLQEAGDFALDLAGYAEFIRRRGTRAAVVCNPSDPDGGFLTRQALAGFLDAMADLDLVVVDESFLEFADAGAEASVAEEAVLRPNVVVLRGLGDNFGLHGVRFGYLVANPALAGRVRSMLPKWNLGALAEHMVFLLREHGEHYAQSLVRVRRDRAEMAGRLSALPGLTVYPSQGNFLFVRLPVGATGPVVRDRLLAEHRIRVRQCGDTIGASSRFLRLVVRPEADVRRLVSALEQVLYGADGGADAPSRAAGTGYSSGTAAVDRLVSETNGAGARFAAHAAGGAAVAAVAGAAGGAVAARGARGPVAAGGAGGAGMPLPAAASVAPAARAGAATPAAAIPFQQPLTATAPAAAVPAPAAAPMPMTAVQPPAAAAAAPLPAPLTPAPAPVPVPATALPTPAPAPAPAPLPSPGPPMPAPFGMPAQTPFPRPEPAPFPMPAQTPFPRPEPAPFGMPAQTPFPMPEPAMPAASVQTPFLTPEPALPAQTPFPAPGVALPAQTPFHTPVPSPTPQTPFPAPMPSPTPFPVPAPVPFPTPVPGPPPSPVPTPPGVPARGGLTAAQVRGMTAPAPGLAPATGWPSPQSWPSAAGMG